MLNLRLLLISILLVLQLATLVAEASSNTTVSRTLTSVTPQLKQTFTPPQEQPPVPHSSPDMEAQAQNRNIYIAVMCVGLVFYVLSGSIFAIKSVRDQKNAFNPTGTAAATLASSSNNNVATAET